MTCRRVPALLYRRLWNTWSALVCLGHATQSWPPTVGHVSIDPLGATPVYQQLAAILRGRIESGELEPDRPLPSLVSLVQQYQVARGTAGKAVGVLVAEGLVMIVPGRGAYVRQRSA
jgi:GntR family transcriptional regulator